MYIHDIISGQTYIYIMLLFGPYHMFFSISIAFTLQMQYPINPLKYCIYRLICYHNLINIIMLYIVHKYRFIVRFPIGLDFLLIALFLHIFLSWTSSLSISSSFISASTLSNHVLLGLPTGLLPSTPYLLHFFTQSSSYVHTISAYHF